MELNTEYRRWCPSNENWSAQVVGSKGKIYTVKYGRHGHNSDCLYDYSCDCDAFKFGKGKPCKHILEAKKHHCQWNHEACIGGGEPAPANGRCPVCGEELTTIAIGV